jgi:Cft2 family RNA processing exonuclease
MNVEYRPEGIFLPDLDLWMDPEGDQPVAFLSHGHADHARGSHGETICSEATAEIYELRGGARSHRRAAPFGQPLAFRGATLTVLPAGHILGAAQLLVELEGERLVYTGDMKLAPPLCADAAVVPRCDHLIIESTFGLPIFKFLSADEARARIISTARDALSEGVTPIFLGYPLGRSQEIVEALCSGGVPVAVHGSVAKFLDIYRRYTGRKFDAVPYDRETSRGLAIVGPPGFGRSIGRTLGKTRVIAVSGWALLDNARARYDADVLIPYSDHASFPELIEYVERAQPKQIDVVHGYADAFATILQKRGFNARAPQSAGHSIDREEAAA